MSKKVNAKKGKLQSTGGKAGRAPMRSNEKIVSEKPTRKFGERPSMPGRPYPTPTPGKRPRNTPDGKKKR